MKGVRLGLVLASTAVAVACVPKREAAPPPPQPRPVQPTPATPPPPPPAAVDWRLAPLTAGTWSYSGQGNLSQASFGPGGSFVVRCDRAQRQVSLQRQGTTSGNVMTIRTTGIARSLPISAQAQPPYVTATLPARDSLLDQMVFSRGRFTVEMAGAPTLIIPSWAEPARVVEDCRG